MMLVVCLAFACDFLLTFFGPGREREMIGMVYLFQHAKVEYFTYEV
jgi:hypothetical protein